MQSSSLDAFATARGITAAHSAPFLGCTVVEALLAVAFCRLALVPQDSGITQWNALLVMLNMARRGDQQLVEI